MIKFLDLFAYWSGIIGAAAFLIVWVIVAAHSISREEAPIGRVFYFKWWLGIMAVGVLATVTTGKLVKIYARDEVRTLVHSAKARQIVIYNQSCRLLQNQKFISVLTDLDVDWPTGSRFIHQKYKIAVITNGNDTIARFHLVQNDSDSTLYRVHYSNYSFTSSNEFGVIKIIPSLLHNCD